MTSNNRYWMGTPRPQKPVRRAGWFGRPEGEGITIGLLGNRQWPRVAVTADAHGKMMALVKACPIEIGWLSSCTREGSNFVIDDVFVPLQICSPASTTITKDGEAALLTALVTQGRADIINRLHCWGHSHVDMRVFASGIDEKQTEEFLAKRTDHFVRLIANKKGDLFCSVYLLQDKLAVHHAILDLEPPATDKWSAWAKEELDVKVTAEALGFGHEIVGELELEYLDPRMLDYWLESGGIDPRLYQRLMTTSTSIRKSSPPTTIEGR